VIAAAAIIFIERENRHEFQSQSADAIVGISIPLPFKKIGKTMTWIQQYRIRRYLASCLWVMPLVAAVAGVCFNRLVWMFDLRTQWRWLDFSPDGARAVVGAIVSSGLTFIVFLLSMLFIAVQIAASQMTPRITARVVEGRASRLSLAFFVFTYVFSTAVGGRLVEPIPQLAVLLTSVFSLVSIGLFLFLVGYVARAVRPISVYANIADETIQVIKALYPVLLAESEGGADAENPIHGIQPVASFRHRGNSGVFTAFNAGGLTEIARKNGCVIQLVPQVGDLVAEGDPLFNVYLGGETIPEEELQQHVAFASSHTLEQNPAFGFRIIVDIAIRALSPAVNDPTTAVRGLDQIHILLSKLGARDLGDGRIRDSEGRPRLIFPAPKWEDFLWLGLSEIRTYGAGSLQVMRRLRGMLENLIETLPSQRIPPLLEHLKQLERLAVRNFPDPEDLDRAGIGDYQGLGGARL
jgi:uncharacterized membrane protein